MRIIFIFLLIVTFISCDTRKPPEKEQHPDAVAAKQDELTFIVFDKVKVDTFLTKYLPIQPANNIIRDGFKNVVTNGLQYSFTPAILPGNTRQPTTMDTSLAADVFKAVNQKDGDSYFIAAVKYLLFYECLPAEFRSKWSQTASGDFRFDTRFFNLLRKKCKIFNDVIYGNTGYWDEKLRAVLREEVYNEITPATAVIIKACIAKDEAFNSTGPRADKDLFVSFLDNVIAGKWRLLLWDWN